MSLFNESNFWTIHSSSELYPLEIEWAGRNSFLYVCIHTPLRMCVGVCVCACDRTYARYTHIMRTIRKCPRSSGKRQTHTNTNSHTHTNTATCLGHSHIVLSNRVRTLLLLFVLLLAYSRNVIVWAPFFGSLCSYDKRYIHTKHTTLTRTTHTSEKQYA